MSSHQVHLSMGIGEEGLVQDFYFSGLGLSQIPKPPTLHRRGDCRFHALRGERVIAEVHSVVDPGFISSKKPHSAFLVENVAGMEPLAQRIQAAGYEFSWTQRHAFQRHERFHCRDPFGKRIEILSLDNTR